MNNPYESGLQPTWDEQRHVGPLASVRTMQIVAFGLIAGLVMFAGVVLFITKADFSGKPGPMAWMGIGIAVIAIVNHFLIPSLMTKTQWKRAVEEGVLNQPDDVKTQRSLMIYQTQMIVGLALLEGAGFCNLTFAMVEKSAVSPGVVMVLVALMLMRFPTQTKVTWWVEEKQRELSQASGRA